MKISSNLVKKLQKKFIFAKNSRISWEEFARLAIAAAKMYFFSPKVIVCQAALESGRGTSEMVRNKNNYFGFMAYDSDPGKAKKYATALDSIIDYLDLITTNPRYAKARQYKTPLRIIKAIKQAGYATDPQYVEKITSLKEWQKNF